ncbi:MAG: DNA polymerase III subunit chi [Hyphomicrobium sp.]
MAMSQAGPAGNTTEVLFYHLERQPLEKVLPGLLERTVQRGWRAVVQSGTDERLDALDLTLWTYSDDSFLAHGTLRDGFTSDQPIYLTTGSDTPNGAKVRFFVDGASAGDLSDLVRAVFLFDGNDDEATALARVQWKAAKAAQYACTYWQQTPEGRWEKKA